jgi:hypothetical protein
MKATKPTIGWREWVRLPDLGRASVKAKVDTGARTSALHAEALRFVRRGGKRFVRFVVYPRQRSKKGAMEAIAPLVGSRSVRSSNGVTEVRPVVLTTLELGGATWEIELTLTRRDVMGFRLLLGRQAIRGHALVDPGRSFLSGPAPRRRRAAGSR